MEKELKPELFGERVVARAKETSPLGAAADMPDFLNVDRRVMELRTQIGTISEDVRKNLAQMQEFMKTAHLRLEKMQQQIQRLESNHNGLAQESGQKLSHMTAKLAERKSLDQKISEMVDRHSGVIRSFEVRMNQLQRLLADKEAQMMSAQASLNEARMEIARLTRR